MLIVSLDQKSVEPRQDNRILLNTPYIHDNCTLFSNSAYPYALTIVYIYMRAPRVYIAVSHLMA